MPIHLIFSPERTNNPFEMARRELVRALVQMPVPAPYGSFVEPEDHEEVKGHIRRASDIFDGWLRSVGEEVQSSATCNVDMRQFTDVFASAIDGNATYELDRLAEEAREEMGAMAS